MRKNKNKILLLISMMVFTTALIQLSLLEEANSSTYYDFGEVEIGSTKTASISITSLANSSTIEISGFEFANKDCTVFSVVSTPESMIIPPNVTIVVEVGFTPSTIETYSNTLRIYDGSPFYYSVNLTGTGVEAKSVQPNLIQNDEIAKLDAERDRKLSKVWEECERERDKALEEYLRDEEKDNKVKAAAKYDKRLEKLEEKCAKQENGIYEWYLEKLSKK